MRKTNSLAEHIAERDRALLIAYRKIISRKGKVSMPKVLHELAYLTEAPRFYVSERRAAIVLSEISQGIIYVTGRRKDMFMELYKRVQALMRSMPEMNLRQSCEEIIYQPAPSFYLTEGTIAVILSKAKRQAYEQTLRRLSHQF